MSIEAALRRIESNLHGQRLDQEGEALLMQTLREQLRPPWLLDLLRRYPIAGANFELSPGEDLSGLGAEWGWLTARQMVGEMTEASPGREAGALGYLEIGSCLIGSGDPYFLDLSSASENPPVVRVPHQAAAGGSLEARRVERVAESLEALLTRSRLDE